MRSFFRPLFSSKPVQIRATPKPITPFGGQISFICFLEKIGLVHELIAAIPFVLTSPNAIPPAQTLIAFICAVVVGAKRFAHADWLRHDKVLHEMLALKRFPGTDTIRNFFLRFTQADIETSWRRLWKWVLPHFLMPPHGFSLDLDSTVFQRSGNQQGAKKGYNPKRPGRNSHHPLLAVLAEAHCVLHAWLRSGNTASGSGVIAFLKEALSLTPAGWVIRCIRADSGFFDQGLFSFLEERSIAYIVVAKMTTQVKRRAAGKMHWKRIDGTFSVGHFFAKLYGWDRKRRFIVIRERVQESEKKKSRDRRRLGHTLFDIPAYTYRVFVTNRPDDGVVIWRDYNQRAVVEQRIEEIKTEMHADGFCLKDFYATESAFLATLFTFNLLSLYQKAIDPQAKYQQPSTLRASIFLGGAILGGGGRKKAVILSEAWGGLKKHIPLIETVLAWVKPTSPKFVLRGWKRLIKCPT
jgi:hypothetical protein